MSIVKVGDINIYYESHGEGEALVFISGIDASYGYLHTGESGSESLRNNLCSWDFCCRYAGSGQILKLGS